MRMMVATLALLTLAAPAVAQTPGAPPSRPADPTAQIARQLNDPATADRLSRAMQSLADAFLALPVGDLGAATEGRAATAAEKRMTVRDAGRRDDPNFDRKFADQMARTRPLVEHGLKTLGTALPAVVQGLRQAGEAVERAAANMPDPTYPRR
ncbi:MAG: hypothetical protein ABIS38_00980 [Sphingomicrobium sp.]